jgi:hypothetical protein
MASYDSPGYVDRTPAGPVSQHTGAPGSGPQAFPDAAAAPSRGTIGDSALVIPSGASTVNGDRVQVSPLDTLSGPQADLYSGADVNTLSSITGDMAGHSGAGAGTVQGAGNPNAAPIGSLAAQIQAARRRS